MILFCTLKRFYLLVALCVLGLAACTSEVLHEDDLLPEVPYAEALQETIDQVLSAYPDYDLGISAAVAVPGYTTWTGVSGFSHPGVPITADMLFCAGSIQKNFEAALVLKLAEEDVLSLDDPISKYVPTYPNVDREITVRQLLNHTSGIFNIYEHPEFPWVGTDVQYSKEWKEEEVFNTFVLDPYGPPGYAQHYSSTNYLLLTTIIEKATGSSVPGEIEQSFLDPLKLDNTFVSMSEHPPAKYAVAHPWVDLDLDGNLEDLYGIPYTWIASLSHPVMFSTAEDLVHWMNALYQEDAVLKSSSLDEMLSYPEVSLADPEGGTYGLGVVDYSYVLREQQVIGHAGSSLGYSGAALFFPEYDISVAWLINTGESPVELAGNVMFDIMSGLSRVIRRNAVELP